MNVTYALNTSTIRCGDLDLPGKIEVTAQAGYDGVELWVDEIDQYTAVGGRPADLKQRLDDAGLRVVNLIAFVPWAAPDDQQRQAALDEARRLFAMSAELGCPYVAASPAGIHTMSGLDLKGIAKRYAELIDLGAKTDTIPVLEYWGIAKTLGTLGEALQVAAECGRPRACLLADIFHTYKGSGHFHGLRLCGPDSIAILHVNDYPATPDRSTIADSDRVYPGDGVAPYPDIAASLKSSGFHGIVSVELFNEKYWTQDPLQVAQTGLRKTRALLQDNQESSE